MSSNRRLMVGGSDTLLPPSEDSYGRRLVFYLPFDGHPNDIVSGIEPENSFEPTYDVIGDRRYMFLDDNRYVYDLSSLNISNSDFSIQYTFLSRTVVPISSYRATFATSKKQNALIHRVGSTDNLGFITHIGDLWEGYDSGWMEPTITYGQPTYINIDVRGSNVYTVFSDGESMLAQRSFTTGFSPNMDNIFFGIIGYNYNLSVSCPYFINDFLIYSR